MGMNEDRIAEERDDLVPVMVPRHLLTGVYGYIAAHDQGESTNGSAPLHRGWYRDLIIEAYRAASDRMRALLDTLADRPGEKVYAEDFMDALGEDRDVVNGVLGSFGRLTNQRFSSRLPDGQNTWPFTVAKDIRDGRWAYEMPVQVAEVIKSIDR